MDRGRLKFLPAPGGGFLKEMSLHDVRIDPDSVHAQAQQTNLEYLLLLDLDRLVWSFRKTSGLQTIGEPYGGWEKPDCELRGHFVGEYVHVHQIVVIRVWVVVSLLGIKLTKSYLSL